MLRIAIMLCSNFLHVTSSPTALVTTFPWQLLYFDQMGPLPIKCRIYMYKKHDICRSFEPIFMEFIWLVRVHSWVNPIVFGNNRPNRTTDRGKCEFKTSFSSFVGQYGFFLRTKLKICIPYFTSPSPLKVYIHFCRPTRRSLKNGHDSKNFFHYYFGKY